MALGTLKNAFKKLSDLGKNYEYFELEDVKFEIGPISRPEEIKAQEYADASSGFTYALRLDAAILSYAIRGAGTREPEAEEFVMESIPDFVVDPDTGKEMERSIMMRNLLATLPSPVIDAMMNKYHTARNKLRDRLGLKPMVDMQKILEDAENMEDVINALPQQEDLQQMADVMSAATSPTGG